jgi:hypothetical protein
MYQGRLSMVTKGPLALFYGGEDIIPELSGFPDSGIPIFTYGSIVFQVCLYLFKWFKSRKLKMYAHTLRKTMIENVLNMYGIIVIILISITAVVYGHIHFQGIKNNNKTKGKTAKLVPNEIILMFMLTMFVIAIPFFKSYALR